MSAFRTAGDIASVKSVKRFLQVLAAESRSGITDSITYPFIFKRYIYRNPAAPGCKLHAVGYDIVNDTRQHFHIRPDGGEQVAVYMQCQLDVFAAGL